MSSPAWGPPAPAPRHATRQEAAAAPGTSGNARRTPRRTARRSTPARQAAGRTSAAASETRPLGGVAARGVVPHLLTAPVAEHLNPVPVIVREPHGHQRAVPRDHEQGPVGPVHAGAVIAVRRGHVRCAALVRVADARGRPAAAVVDLADQGAPERRVPARVRERARRGHAVAPAAPGQGLERESFVRLAWRVPVDGVVLVEPVVHAHAAVLPGGRANLARRGLRGPAGGHAHAGRQDRRGGQGQGQDLSSHSKIPTPISAFTTSATVVMPADGNGIGSVAVTPSLMFPAKILICPSGVPLASASIMMIWDCGSNPVVLWPLLMTSSPGSPATLPGVTLPGADTFRRAPNSWA